jgi:hypothetical protein
VSHGSGSHVTDGSDHRITHAENMGLDAWKALDEAVKAGKALLADTARRLSRNLTEKEMNDVHWEAIRPFLRRMGLELEDGNVLSPF